MQADAPPLLNQSTIKKCDDMSSLATGFPMDHAEAGFDRKTKIICTMGPSCWDEDMLGKLIEAGMNCARLNFSHGDHGAQGKVVARLRKVMQKYPDKPVGILLDTKGPEIRSGFFREDCGGKVELKAGQDLKLVTDYDFKGDNTCIACTYTTLPTSVKPGNQILMADGTVVLEVKECNAAGGYVMCKVLNNAMIGERKNMNLPGVKVELPVLGETDKHDILNFGIPQGVNYVAASFVQTGSDVESIRQLLGAAGSHIKIISKIENEAGLKNFDDILEKSDGIMVARGDLGMEIPTEKVFVAQKTMIAKCNAAGKFVITATQMLESMTGNPRPTRAEASDVANAVLDGSDAVMLSGETAGGAFPLNAVATMRRICETAEDQILYPEIFQATYANARSQLALQGGMSNAEMVCSSAVRAANDCDCISLVVVLPEAANAVDLIAKYRPRVPIMALDVDHQATKDMSLVRGVIPVSVTEAMLGGSKGIKLALEKAKGTGMVKVGDTVVVVGSNYGAGEALNFDLVEVP
jgi:pyruvate kinase